MDLTPFKNCLAHTTALYVSNDRDPYRPCCWFKNGISANSYSEYQQSLSDMDIQENCSHCINQESGGLNWSHRMLYKSSDEATIGICFDNICNLKCITCSPIHSSKLIDEWIKIKRKDERYDRVYYTRISKQAPTKIDFIIDAIKSMKFKKINIDIFGGEPLINSTVYKFLDWLIEQNLADKTRINITTNGTTYSERVVEYISKFSGFGLQFSIDGINEYFEYLRYGTDFNQVTDNINRYYQILENNSSFTCGFNYTLSWMNSLHFADFYEWTATNYPKIHLYLTKLEGPDYYSVNILNKATRDLILDTVNSRIINNTPSNQFKQIKSLYEQSMTKTLNVDGDSQKFSIGIDQLELLDQVRSVDHRLVLADVLRIIKSDIS